MRLAQNEDMVQALTSWRYRTPVPCLHADPGYAANWGRPTNDTRTRNSIGTAVVAVGPKHPPRFGASDSGQRGLKELFVRVLVAPSFIEVSGQEVTERP